MMGPDPVAAEDPASGGDPVAEPEAAPSSHPDFDIAFESGSARMFGGRAGFFCVWENEITFVASAWVRWVMAYVHVLPARVAPTGTEDPRTRTRIPFSDVASVQSGTAGRHGAARALRTFALGDRVVVTSRDGAVRHYTGGRINPGFTFSNVAPLLASALEAAGYQAEATGETLTVHGDAGRAPAPTEGTGRG